MRLVQCADGNLTNYTTLQFKHTLNGRQVLIIQGKPLSYRLMRTPTLPLGYCTASLFVVVKKGAQWQLVQV